MRLGEPRIDSSKLRPEQLAELGAGLPWVRDHLDAADCDESTNIVLTLEPAAAWLRLERDGATYIGSYSLDGSTWHRVGSVELPDVADVQDVGLFASAVNVFRPGVCSPRSSTTASPSPHRRPRRRTHEATGCAVVLSG